MAKNKLWIEFANETGVYPINVGTTFTDVFGETLDSASVIISKITNKLDIKPNDEVRIYNESGFIFGKNSLYYLIDTVYCKEITLNDEIQYQYTIELKSLTSYLDLVQLPNRTLNHSLVSGQKLIIDYIEQFVFLYAPKVKYTNGSSWSYKRLFDVDTSTEFVEKFSVPCMDLSFSQPTLRQAITSLMLQVGCLPKIVKIEGENLLTFLDLREPPKAFADIDQSTNYTSYSYASDSYVNTLVGMSDNVLDDENVVITETIGFRDTSNVLLKQKENLKLNTIYPIYDVEKLVIKVPIRANVKLKNKNTFGGFSFYVGLNETATGLQISGATFLQNLYYMQFDTAKTRVYAFKKIVDVSTGDYKIEYETTYNVSGIEITPQNNTLVSSVSVSDNSFFVLVGVIKKLVLNDETTFENVEITTTNFEGADSVLETCYFFFERDITPLCVERNKRNLLDTDFLKMNQEVNTVEKLSKYIYGTVAYDIGGKVIEGFSSTYSEFTIVDFWDGTRTYIENMYGKIMNVDNYLTPNIEKQLRKKIGNIPVEAELYANDYSAINYEGAQLFTSLLFDITYKPLNSLRVNHIKEEEQFYRLEQLDTNENAISNFNDVVRVEQQKVNRLGNEVVVKNQRTKYDDAINDLNTQFDDYIVFNRVVSVGIEDFKVNYTASKNYVLQNYFTAIQTKYRAYEYNSYGASVVRKENTTIFGRIGRDYYDGDDNIYFGVRNQLDNKHLEYLFLSGAVNQYDNQYLYKCAAVGDDYGIAIYKTDLSIIIAESMFAFATQDFDSVSYGIAIDIDHENYNNLGGLPQRWIIKGENSGYDKFCYLLLNGDDSETSILKENKSELLETIRKSFTMPRIQEPDYENALSVVDNNKTEYYTALAKTYYLDKQEVLNNTIQFVFYATDDSILWSEKLWQLSWFVCKEKPKGKRYMYIPSDDEEFGINKTSYTSVDVSKLKEMSFDSYELAFENGALRLRWAYIADNLKWTKVIYEEDGKYFDLLAIKNINNLRTELFYITLNDTKTDKVAYNKNGLYSFNEYVVAKNTLNRSVEKL